MKPYQELEKVAAALKAEGFEIEASKLLNAHAGIFNNTELYMTWRFALTQILAIDELSDAARLEVRRAYSIMDKALTD